MPRSRKGTPEGNLATERWRKTMQERYGDPSEIMRARGAIGGKAQTTKPKGFAADNVRAHIAGSLGS